MNMIDYSRAYERLPDKYKHGDHKQAVDNFIEHNTDAAIFLPQIEDKFVPKVSKSPGLWVTFGCPMNLSTDPNDEFSYKFKEPRILIEDFPTRVLKGIDNCVYREGICQDLSMGYKFFVEGLSGGCKLLILLWAGLVDEFWGTALGDNCIPYLIEVARIRKLKMWLQHDMKLDDYITEVYSCAKHRKYSDKYEYWDECDDMLCRPEVMFSDMEN